MQTMVHLLATLYATLPQVAFVPIVAGEAPPTTSADIYAALVEIVEAQPLLVEPLSYNQLLVQSPSMSASQVRDCGADAACVARVFREHTLELIVVAAVNFELEPWSVALTIIHPDTMRSDDRLVALDPTEGPLLARKIAEASVGLLTAHGAVRGGRARVAVSPPGAQIVTPGELVAVGPRLYRGPPGIYTLQAHAEGHAPATTTLRIVAGQESLTRVTLNEEVSLVEQPAFWVVTGAVVVAVAAGVTAGLLLSGPNDPVELCFAADARECR
jgi:hypothetical protein